PPASPVDAALQATGADRAAVGADLARGDHHRVPRADEAARAAPDLRRGRCDVKLAIADPPYPGQAAKHYADHPDYAGEVDHAELLKRLDTDYDGWALHTSSVALGQVLGYAADLGVDGF